MRKTIGIAAVAALLLSLRPGGTYAQRGAAPPPAPELLFRMGLQNTTRLPIVQDLITTPNLELQHYGDGQNIVVAVGSAEYLPRLFNGLCKGPCGLTFRDKNNYFDLRGKAKIRWTTIVSGFHRARPLIRLADGRLLIGDQAHGSVADWQQSEVSLSEVRWLALDPVRGVTLGNWVENVDLSKVDEVGYFDVIPGSGVWSAQGLPVEKQPAPPVGGWIAMYAFELWGRPVSRSAK